jgi:two-component system, NarL family, sensor histidine kinase LiaS
MQPPRQSDAHPLHIGDNGPMRSRFGKLRWQLMLSYTLVTVLASLGWLLVVFGLSSFITYGSPLLHTRLADYAAGQTLGIRDALSTSPPNAADLSRWVESRERGLPWPVLSVLDMSFYGLDLRQAHSALIVFDAAGTPIASTQKNAHVGALVLSPVVQHWVNEALKGNADVAQTSGREPLRGLYAAVPVFDEARTVRGALLVMDEEVQWQRPISYLFSQVVTGLLPLFALMFPVAILFGPLAGAFVSRPLIRRINTMGQASLHWSQGGFDARVSDVRKDELGELSQRLDSMANQLGLLMTARQENASLQERNRIARELHDSTKQQAYAVAGQLAAARALLQRDPNAAELRLHEAEKLNDTLRAELAHLILELRPPQLDHRGVATVLREYVQDWSRHTSIAVAEHIEDIALPNELEQAVFRIAQESLSNIVRHGAANQVVVTLQPMPAGSKDKLAQSAQFMLKIEDNGKGFETAVAKSGFGLQSMQQRAEAVGAKLDIQSTVGQGTCVTFTA